MTSKLDDIIFGFVKKKKNSRCNRVCFWPGEGAQMLINNGLEEFGGVGGALVFETDKAILNPLKWS